MYADRHAASEKLEQRFESFLKSKPQVVYKNTGAENNYERNFCDRLIKLSETSELAAQLRYMPDFTVVTDTEIIYFDVKSCKNPKDPIRTIERHAYQHYIKTIQKHETKVRLVCELPAGDLVSIDPRELHFVRDANYKNHWGVPVEDEIWRNPRADAFKNRYDDWKREFPFASGTPMAYWDISKTPYKILK